MIQIKASLDLADLVDWEIQEEQDVAKLIKRYHFSNFVDAITFTNRVGDLAERDNHHPTLITEWGKVTVLWWTHDSNGLEQKDFLMAKKTDLLFAAK